MTLPISAKFFNQILNPLKSLMEILANHPFVLEPESNVLLHQFEGLVLHTNHFAEKNGLNITLGERFRDLANSIKHIRSKQEKQINIKSALIYEVSDKGFRFIRNTMRAQYVVSCVEFDALKELYETIRLYLPLVNLKMDDFEIYESKYSFYEWVFAYYKEEYASLVECTSIITVKKDSNNYIEFNSGYKFVVFDQSIIGCDPNPYFPIS